MVIRDAVYGEFDVTNKVLIQLIDSAAVQRLKGIAQYGIPDVFSNVDGFSRYDHSIGVMLLLRKLGASEEEQVAGLLHDVSHTTFSHLIDWVFGSGATETHQDEQHETYIQRTDLPRILQVHGYSVERISDYHRFGLLERDIPDLCADRVDYSLRELPTEIAAKCVKDLVAHQGQIVFSTEASAKLYATEFLKLQTDHWGSFENVARYRIFANVLRMALADGLVDKDDFWQTDEFVIAKLVASPNPKIQELLTMLRQKSLNHLPKGTTRILKKFRYIDPLFISGDVPIRLSSVDDSYVQALEHARQSNEQGILIPAIVDEATA